MRHRCPEVSRTFRYEGKWIRFEQANYTDPQGIQRSWEYVSRVTSGNQRPGLPNAVEMIVKVTKDGEIDRLVIVKQFRPPLGKFCLEFPAGLVDSEESIEQAARRELEEECGIKQAKLRNISPPLLYEAGLSNTLLSLVEFEVSTDEWHQRKPILEEDEWSLESIAIPLSDLYSFLEQSRASGCEIDGKLYLYAMMTKQ